MKMSCARCTSAHPRACARKMVFRAGTYVMGMPAPIASSLRPLGTSMSAVRAGGGGGAADGAEVETQDQVRMGAEGRRHLLRRLELAHVALAIVERQRGALVPLGTGDGEGRRGIEAAREQHDSARRHYTP